MLVKLRLPNMMYEQMPSKPFNYYNHPFKASKIDKFLVIFSRAKSSWMFWEVR